MRVLSAAVTTEYGAHEHGSGAAGVNVVFLNLAVFTQYMPAMVCLTIRQGHKNATGHGAGSHMWA